MKNSVIAIQSFVITTIVYALLVPVFFEMENNAFGEEKNIVDNDNDKTTYSQQLAETKNVNLLIHLLQKCVLLCVLKNLFFISFY
jgi:hypothetical protein